MWTSQGWKTHLNSVKNYNQTIGAWKKKATGLVKTLPSSSNRILSILKTDGGESQIVGAAPFGSSPGGHWPTVDHVNHHLPSFFKLLGTYTYVQHILLQPLQESQSKPKTSISLMGSVRVSVTCSCLTSVTQSSRNQHWYLDVLSVPGHSLEEMSKNILGKPRGIGGCSNQVRVDERFPLYQVYLLAVIPSVWHKRVFLGSLWGDYTCKHDWSVWHGIKAPYRLHLHGFIKVIVEEKQLIDFIQSDPGVKRLHVRLVV